MDLFSQFDDAPKNLLPKDGTVNYYGIVLSKELADDYYEVLLSLESGHDLVRNSPRKLANGMGIGVDLNNRKDLNFNTSNSYGLLSKSANDPDYNLPKNTDFQERNSPIRMTSQVVEGYQNYTNCVDCQKNNNYHHRLITPCTHNGSNIDSRTSKSTHMSPTRIAPDNISEQGFEINNGYLPSEHWN